MQTSRSGCTMAGRLLLASPVIAAGTGVGGGGAGGVGVVTLPRDSRRPYDNYTYCLQEKDRERHGNGRRVSGLIKCALACYCRAVVVRGSVAWRRSDGRVHNYRAHASGWHGADEQPTTRDARAKSSSVTRIATRNFYAFVCVSVVVRVVIVNIVVVVEARVQCMFLCGIPEKPIMIGFRVTKRVAREVLKQNNS